MDLAAADLLLIENVGNLLCPSQYDLGEHLRVAVLSVAEGADKPDKYPAAFQRSAAVVIYNVDLLALIYVKLTEVTERIRLYAPEAAVFVLSARTGEGMEAWTAWVKERVRTHG